MSLTDQLITAGDRAARRPVPSPPSVEQLHDMVGIRRSRKRRRVGAAIAASTVLVVGGVMAVAVDDRPDSLVTAASDEAEPGTEDTPSTTAPDDVEDGAEPQSTLPNDDDGGTAEDQTDGDSDTERWDHDFRMELMGEGDFSVVVIGGDGANSAADAAAAKATETRDVDGVTVWLDEQGENTEAAALVEPELFVRVTGPTESIDSLLDLVTRDWPEDWPEFDAERFDRWDETHGFPSLEDLLPPELAERLDEWEGGDPWARFEEKFPELFERANPKSTVAT